MAGRIRMAFSPLTRELLRTKASPLNPDFRTTEYPIISLIDTCGSLTEFHQIHALMLVCGLSNDAFAASRAVQFLASVPSDGPDRAILVFTHTPEPDAFTCNTIIKSLIKNNSLKKALKFYYHHMLEREIQPNHCTFPLLVKISSELKWVLEGEKNHCWVLKLGLEWDLYVRNSLVHMYSIFGNLMAARRLFDTSLELDIVSYNSMVDGYAKNGEVALAREMFDEMPQRNMVSWNSMVNGYCVVGDMEAAVNLFQMMPVRNEVSWNAMINGYAKQENFFQAKDLFDRMPKRNLVSWNTMIALCIRTKNYEAGLKLFDEMCAFGLRPNEATLVSVLCACAHTGELNRGKWVHSYINENKSEIEFDALLGTALLTMYAKCGSIEDSRKVFNEMPEKNVVSWNAIIGAYATNGGGQKALDMFTEMQKMGVKPNQATFICVLSACTRAGLVVEGCWYFDLMSRTYGIEPKVEHCGCMIVLLRRAGLLCDFKELIGQMPMELGERIAKRVIDMEPQNIGPYLLLSHIYAANGRWDDVEKVRRMIKNRVSEEKPGCSLVEVDRFGVNSIVGDGLVHKTSMMYSMLAEVATHMKSSGS
ncbi:hypothetical protein AMTRI_Chr09g32990 [Amborella trichopoda]|uniref:pentatricopeptide repeat-containing protein At1g08070, chloroplastic n=1 Tax=Amborella trichopoda TaxID=13333 RepID=UPI0009C16A96|nr:pentatricopeptide repeat-containing protein At1g08070, chloroplastic [Amborella trichopoda]|eukprot:XP_011624808.2 pentatricopeptide repeat-containing protein At1g08070, chloroplastic [Amborella trichopoda]